MAPWEIIQRRLTITWERRSRWDLILRATLARAPHFSAFFICPEHWLCFSAPCLHHAGLQGEHLLAAAMEWSTAGVQWIPRWLPGPGPFYARLHLETWLVFCKWERGPFPWDYYRQQAAENLQKWECTLQHQVSWLNGESSKKTGEGRATFLMFDPKIGKWTLWACLWVKELSCNI